MGTADSENKEPSKPIMSDEYRLNEKNPMKNQKKEECVSFVDGNQ